MSTYEDYSRTAVDYDTTRVAVGLEVVLGTLLAAGIDPRTAHVLDAGCGTGTYAAALAPHVGRLTLVDGNPSMLAEAEAKLARQGVRADEVELHQRTLPGLGFDDGAFDAIVVNQVLHHLGDEEGGRWTAHQDVIADLARSLRPGGVLVVNTCSQTQLRRSFWYYALIPRAADALRRRYAPLDAIESAMAVSEMEPLGRFVPGDIIQGQSYFDGRAPLDEVWRHGDSAWSLARHDEVATAREEVRRLDDAGELDAFVASHDRLRPDLGQVTFLTARRS